LFLRIALLSLLAALAIRAPLRPHRLYNEDSVTLARAVDRYDPRHLFPQPPGYPLFILQSKILRSLTGNVERAFNAGVVLATAAALLAIIALSRAMFATWMFTALLLAINPVFLFTGMTSPIRVYLAAISTIVAALCWRAWNGDGRSASLAAIALAIGSGYRPELLALLFPLWAVSTWRSKHFLRPAVLLTVISAMWIGFLLSRFPDLHAFRETFSQYATDQTRDTSVLFGTSEIGRVRTLFRVLMWNGTAIFGWIALAPLAKPAWKRGTIAFIALWIVPSIAFHALVHVEDPDQTLSTLPAFCILGGAVLASFWKRNRDVALLGLASTVIVNLALFVSPFPLSPKPTAYKPAIDALWQFSYGETRDVRARTDAVLAALHPFAESDHTIVMWNRSRVTWRALSYYNPSLTFCLLMDDRHAGTHPHAAFWRDLALHERYLGDPALVPLGDANQIVWIVGPLAPILPAIAPRLVPVGEGVWRSNAEPMNIPGYKLVW
jgi:hypothetical protein